MKQRKWWSRNCLLARHRDNSTPTPMAIGKHHPNTRDLGMHRVTIDLKASAWYLRQSGTKTVETWVN